MRGPGALDHDLEPFAVDRGRGLVALERLEQAAEPVLDELTAHRVGRLAQQLDLVERLHGREPRGPALVEDRLGALSRLIGDAAQPASPQQQGQRRAGGTATLVLACGVGALQGLRLVLDGEDAVADGGSRSRTPSSIRPRQLSPATSS